MLYSIDIIQLYKIDTTWLYESINNYKLYRIYITWLYESINSYKLYRIHITWLYESINKLYRADIRQRKRDIASLDLIIP